MYFKYLDFPTIPRELLVQNYKDFSSMENFFRKPGYPYYKQYHVSDELHNYLKSILPFEFTPSYQVIRNGIDIHIDHGRKEAINYLIDTGGEDATLNIYDENKSAILYQEKIQKEKWHVIDVTVNHTVVNITGVRFALTLSNLKTKFL